MDSQPRTPSTVPSLTNNNAATIPIPEATAHFTTPSNTSHRLQHIDPGNTYTFIHAPLHNIQIQEQAWLNTYGSDHRLPSYPFYDSPMSPISTPLRDPAQSYAPHLTHDNYSTRDAIVHPPPTASLLHLASAPRNSSTTSRTSSMSTAGLDTRSQPHGIKRNCVHLEVPADFFQPTTPATASSKDAGGSLHDTRRQEMDRLEYGCTQCHQCVPKADHLSHYLGHLNLKEWGCTCGKPFRRHSNAIRHVKECVPCSTCHKKIGRNGDGISRSRCLRSMGNGSVGGDDE